MLFKLKSNGDADLVEICKVLEHLQMTQDTFARMCIAAGCDHLRNIRGIGIKRAKDIVSKSGFEERLASLANAPPDYMKNFVQVEMVFKHQTVFNVVENCLKPLNPWPSEAPSCEVLEACGLYPFNKLIIKIIACLLTSKKDQY